MTCQQLGETDIMTDKIINLRKKLHENAEPSLMETNTKHILMEFIRDNTNLEIIDCGMWFYAVYRAENGKKNIAFRADFDAVLCSDGKARHLCGHDGHSACLAGFASEIEKTAPPVNVYFIFQPAEEIGKGAEMCCEIFRNCRIDEIYGFHNIPNYAENEILLLKKTFACASTGMEITLTGKPSHAAYPEQGVNPSAAISEIILYTNEYLKVQRRGIVLGTVIGADIGSSSYGVSADKGVLRLTLRAEYQEEYDNLIRAVSDFAEKTAEKENLSCKIKLIEEFPATENHSESVDKVRKTAEILGLSVSYPTEPFRWSEDFGHYLKYTKGAFFGIGCGINHTGLHTENYVFNDNIIETAIRLFAEIAMTEGGKQ